MPALGSAQNNFVSLKSKGYTASCIVLTLTVPVSLTVPVTSN